MTQGLLEEGYCVCLWGRGVCWRWFSPDKIKSPFMKTVSSVWKEVVGRRGDFRGEIWGMGVIWLPKY